MQTVILGAGIGGLTTAVALQKKQAPYRIFESAPRLDPMGAGIWLAPNAMQCFRFLGLDEEVRAVGMPIRQIIVADKSGKPIQILETDFFEQRYGFPTVALLRSSLQQLLLALVSKKNLHMGKKYTQLVQKESEVQLFFSDGSTTQGNLVVAADGIHSQVRRHLFPSSTIRWSGQICFRGLASFVLEAPWKAAGVEIWHEGLRFGFSQVTHTQVYWYLTQNQDSSYGNKQLSSQNSQALFFALQDKMKGFISPVTQLLAATPWSSVLRSDLCDLTPLPRWTLGRVALLGDAAHGMTPNLGQGACQATEDAIALGLCFAHDKSVEQILCEYEKTRRQRANRISRQSFQVGRISSIKNRWISALRNKIIRALPSRIHKRELDWLYQVPGLS